MGIADDMKRVAKEIVSSYESRISAVGTIIDNTHQILEDFKNKRNEMSNQLKETLATGESLRKKDFDNMMKDILARQDEREKQVKELLKTYLEEQRDMAVALKNALAEGESIRISDFKTMLQDIQARQKEREEEISKMLKDFREEHEEMAQNLRSLLDKGERSRIEDFKEMLKGIRTRQKEREEETKRMLEGYQKEHKEMAAQWQKLALTMAERRAIRNFQA